MVVITAGEYLEYVHTKGLEVICCIPNINFPLTHELLQDLVKSDW